MGYKLLRSLVRLMLAVFYRRIEVVGLERIPANGALIASCVCASQSNNARLPPNKAAIVSERSFCQRSQFSS